MNTEQSLQCRDRKGCDLGFFSNVITAAKIWAYMEAATYSAFKILRDLCYPQVN